MGTKCHWDTAWRTAKKDDDLDDRLNTLVSSLQPHLSTAEGGEEQISDPSTLVEDGGRGGVSRHPRSRVGP